MASLGTIIGILNASTLIIALPTMMVKLNRSFISVTWVLIVFMLILPILAPACAGLLISMAAVPVDRRGFASSMRAFFNNTGMVISMTIAMPLLIGMIPLDKMMDLFVVGSANLPVAIQIPFTNAICFVFMISAILTIPAIIVSAMRGKEDLDTKKSIPDNSPRKNRGRVLCLSPGRA